MGRKGKSDYIDIKGVLYGKRVKKKVGGESYNFNQVRGGKGICFKWIIKDRKFLDLKVGEKLGDRSNGYDIAGPILKQPL